MYLRHGGNSSTVRRLYIKVKIANFIFGDQVRKQKLFNFSDVCTILGFWEISPGTDLGTEYIVTTAFQSYPTEKK